MHRVDTKRRRTTALRVVAYAVTLLLTTVTTVVLLYVALGYRFNSGHVTRSGLLLVDNNPEAGAVYINGELKDASTPSRFVLKAGTYHLELKRSDYHDWSKQVSVAASGVREVRYPFLIPKKLRSKHLLDLDMLTLASQSKDKKLLLTYTENATQFNLITLDPKSPKQTTLDFTTAVRNESGKYGSFKVIEWALNNKEVLIAQTLPSGAVNLLSLDVTKPEELINITDQYGEQAPNTIHYVGGDTDKIYGLKDGVLSSYSLKQNERTELLSHVRSYQPYSDDTILFDRQADKNNEVGIWKDKAATVVTHTALSAAPTLLQYANYEDNYYFVVASPTESKVVIYQDPLKKPILKQQLPLTTLAFSEPQEVDFSASSQFILIQHDNSFLTYDLDDLLKYQVTLPFTLAAGTRLEWVDSSHVVAQTEDFNNYLLEYDGQNSHAIVNTAKDLPLLYANNFEHVYQLAPSDDALKLQAVSLVANKQ